MTWALKSPSSDTSLVFNTVHLLPKGLRFEHGGAKLVSCCRDHLTSVCPSKSPSLLLAPDISFFRSLPKIHDHR